MTDSSIKPLRIKDLVMVRGTKAVVHAIRFEVQPGQVTALMGPNGAGKTSTVLGLAGAIAPAFGEIWLDDVDVKGWDADVIRRAGIATVPEGHQVLRDMTVRDNLLLAASFAGKAEQKLGLERAVELFPELKPRLTVMAGDLSGGQQQMVSIAQAMMGNPKYLVIDELSFGLAPTIVARLAPIIRQIAAQGIGVLLIEQFTQLALLLASHAYVMSRGKISFDGSPVKLREDPSILHRAYFPVSDSEAVGLA
ncbi:MAG: ATP-binding cassette domain-containing protein [Candidatus Symbiobacter sp.]|nr:ATP-binding cassette domain-containing protein [Candidatus Symbiobacter sp.]